MTKFNRQRHIHAYNRHAQFHDTKAKISFSSGIAPIILLSLQNFLANLRPLANNHLAFDHEPILFCALPMYTFSNL